VLPYIFLLFSLFVIPEESQVHDFHVSQALVNYNAGNRSFEISMHIFIDDLEIALEERGAEKLFIATNKEKTNTDEYIFEYLRDRFHIISDSDTIDFNFLGKETSHDLMAVWCYLEASEIPSPNEITIFNSILTEIYSDQRNLITFTCPGLERYLLFDKKKAQTRIQIR
jgi:hypothetical protein